MDAIRRGTPIVTDTQMGKAGINKRKLAEFGSEVYCFMSDEDVAAAAKGKWYDQGGSKYGQRQRHLAGCDLCGRKCTDSTGSSV